MKILHTSDWHLGKYLEKYSRIYEQEKFINELISIADKNQVDMIIIAGDIYDTTNPTIEAERLFFRAIKRLSLGGKRPILIISGNHDSGERLMSSAPLAIDQGIILIGSPTTIITPFKHQFFEITHSGKGFFKIEIKGETTVFITIPYITEKNLNEVIFKDDESEEHSYSQKIKSILDDLSQNFEKHTTNIVIGHFFVLGGLECDSERKIQTIGGLYSVSTDIFPENTSYVALGHLHRPQKIKAKVPIYYSGSPIQYGKSEINYKKSVYILDFTESTLNSVNQVHLTNYKPIEIWKCKDYDEALQKCMQNSDTDCWVYLEINTTHPLLASQLRQLRESKRDIVNITVYFNNDDTKDKTEYTIKSNSEKLNIKQHFENFYFNEKGIYPREDLVSLFLDLLENDEEIL